MNLRIMMRRLNKRNLWLLLLPFLLTACQSYKKVPYFQNVEVVNEVEQQEKLYDAKIMPKDLLTIVVSCTGLFRGFSFGPVSPGGSIFGTTQ